MNSIFYLIAFGNDIFNSLIFQNAKRSDERIGFINEIISGIRVIKMYAWEIPFLKMIDKYRRYVIFTINKEYYR